MTIRPVERTCETCGVKVHTYAGNFRWCESCRVREYPKEQAKYKARVSARRKAARGMGTIR